MPPNDKETHNYCVYVYKLKNIVVYVGNGSRLRPKSKSSRSRAVLSLFDSEFFTIEILSSGLSKQEAIDLENNFLSFPLEDWQLINKRPACDVLELTFDFCNNYWYYDETSPSCLRWKIDRKGARNQSGFTAVHKDTVAGSRSKAGYFKITCQGKTIRAHRIIYVLSTQLAIEQHNVIDHIDGNPSNNKISNLASITQKENMIKKSLPTSNKRNSSGCIGVSFDERDQAYIAYIQENSKRVTKYFGVEKFLSKEEAFRQAILWRKQKEVEVSATIATLN